MDDADSTKDDDHHIPPVRMDQSMSVAAVMVGAMIGTFGRQGDSEDDLWKVHMVCLSTFLYQLLIVAKHKRELISILHAIIAELEDAITKEAA